MKHNETINLIGKWICVLSCIGAAIYFAAQGQTKIAGGFGLGAWVMLWFL